MGAFVLDSPFDEVATRQLRKSKGFDRDELPQIQSADVEKFIAFLRRKGVKVTAGEAPVADLKPTQSELNKDKIKKFTSGGLTDKLRSPIIISKDNYVLDGHHRWAAVKELDAKGTIRTHRVEVPIKELIQLGHEFPKSFTKEIHEALALTVKHGPVTGSHPEARYHAGVVTLTPKFDLLTSEAKRHVLFHEVGHWFRDRYIPLSEIMGWSAGEGFLIYGQPNSEEGFAEAFASYFTDPDHFKRAWPAAHSRMRVYVRPLERAIREWVTRALASPVEEARGDAYQRRADLQRAWKGHELPDPAPGQVWVSSAEDVVIVRLATHFTDTDIRIPGGTVVTRTRQRKVNRNFGTAMFKQMFVPAWRPGEIVLTEAQLDEEVQQLRKYLGIGQYQVLDLGTVGLFRVYSVLAYPADDQSIIAVRNLRRIQRNDWAIKHLGKVHTLRDYQKNHAAGVDEVVFLTDPAVENWSWVRGNIQEASDAITSLGVPRQRDTIILRNLSGEKNRITGGGVGGYAYRRTHAIELDTNSMIEGGTAAPELLVHEWGHKQFFNLPQHVTSYVRDWFRANLLNNPALDVATRVVEPADREAFVTRAWGGFKDAWQARQGLGPEEFVEQVRRVRKEGLSPSGTGRLLDYVTRGANVTMAYGHMTKGLRNPEGGRGLRKGDVVGVMSARADGPDNFKIIGEKAPRAFLDADRATVIGHVEFDRELTLKNNPKFDYDQAEYASRAVEHVSLKERLTNEGLLYDALDGAASGLYERLRAKGYVGYETSLTAFPILSFSKFVQLWTDRVQAEYLDFDAKKAFRDIFPTLVHWDIGAVEADPVRREYRLSTPEGQRVRELAKKLGLTPSSYGAANVDELWAELIAHAARHPGGVPKPLKNLLRDAMQGKTPAPGPRVRVDRTPDKFKKVAHESLVLDLPCLDEAAGQVTKPQLDALERQLDALFRAAEIDIEFTRHFLDRVNDPRNGRPITIAELQRIYQAVWDQHRATLDKADVDWKVVIRDLPTQINIPVVLDYDTRTNRVELVAKTVMRTARFMAREPQLVVRSESVQGASPVWFTGTRLRFAPSNAAPPPATPFDTVLRSAEIGMSVTIDGEPGRIARIAKRARMVSITLANTWGQRLKPFAFHAPRADESWLTTSQLPIKGEVVRFLSDRGFGATEDEMWAAFSEDRFFRGDRAELRRVLRQLVSSRRLHLSGDAYTMHESLEEGVDDPHVLKAVFLAGGGGSGKSFIGGKTFGDTGLRVVNTDPYFEHLMRKAGLDLKKDVGSDKAQALRPRAKALAGSKEKQLAAGRVGLIIDGTGDNPEKIRKKKAELEALGYDTSMMFVEVPIEVALDRNAKRARVVPEAVLRAAHNESQAAKELYRKMFGERYVAVENAKALTPEEIARDLTPKLARIAMKLVDGPVKNPVGRKWIKDQINPGESHRALGKGGSDTVSNEKPDVDQPESLIRWRTTRGGRKIGFNKKGRAVMGNPHVLKALSHKRESFDERAVSIPSKNELTNIHGSRIPPGHYTVHAMADNDNTLRLKSPDGKGYLVRAGDLAAEQKHWPKKTDGKGRWRTTSSGRRIYIENGKVTKGNPHVLAAMRESVVFLDRAPFGP